MAHTEVSIGRDYDWKSAAAFLAELDARDAARNAPEASDKDDSSSKPRLVPIYRATLVEENRQSPRQSPQSDEPIPRAIKEPATARPYVARPVLVPETPAPAPRPAPYIRPVQNLPAAKKSRGGLSPKFKAAIGTATSVTIVLALIGLRVYLRSERRADRNQEPETQQQIVENQPVPSASPNFVDSRFEESTSNTTAPLMTAGMVFRPSFGHRGTFFEAGTAFAASVPGSTKPIILTALHLFGPAGGLERDISATQIPSRLSELKLTDCINKRLTESYTGKVLVLTDSKPFPEPSSIGDVVAFMTHGNRNLRPLAITPLRPKVGERVWLFSEVINGPATVHGATVQGYENDWMLYNFDNPNIELVATSGAPIVNARQEVVAINAGGGKEGNTMLGVGTPSSKFIDPLSAAVGSIK